MPIEIAATVCRRQTAFLPRERPDPGRGEMIATCCSIVLAAAVGAGPAPVPPAPVQQPAAAPMAPTTVIAGTPAAVEACGGCPDPRYPFDAQDAWIHGYIQEVTAYGGFTAFRPYNYKHVLAQSQAAASWGMSPTAPYSQSFWHDPARRQLATGPI